VDDADVQVLDEQQDVGAGVGAAGAEMAQAAGDAQGDGAVAVDADAADAVVGVAGAVAGGGPGPGGVGGGGGGAVLQRPVRPPGVAGVGEGVWLVLELGEGRGLGGLGGEPFLEGLLESPGFPLGLGVVRVAVLLGDAEAAQLGFQGVAAALAAGQPGGEDQPVVGEGGGRGAVRGDGGAELVQDNLAVTWWCAVTRRAYREWSSSQVRISVAPPPGSG
jgi:hypothetical protein